MLYLPRTPYNCPSGLSRHYIVKPGDSMYKIATSFGISAGQLIQVNPHIINPAIIYPGDVLCIPKICTVPFSITLKPQTDLPIWAGGVAHINISAKTPHRIQVNVYAKLPEPSFFGNYNDYRTYIEYDYPDGYTESSSRPLRRVPPSSLDPESPPNWLEYLDTDYTLTPNAKLSIGANTTDESGMPTGDLLLLQANLGCFIRRV